MQTFYTAASHGVQSTWMMCVHRKSVISIGPPSVQLDISTSWWTRWLSTTCLSTSSESLKSQTLGWVQLCYLLKLYFMMIRFRRFSKYGYNLQAVSRNDSNPHRSSGSSFIKTPTDRPEEKMSDVTPDEPFNCVIQTGLSSNQTRWTSESFHQMRGSGRPDWEEQKRRAEALAVAAFRITFSITPLDTHRSTLQTTSVIRFRQFYASLSHWITLHHGLILWRKQWSKQKEIYVCCEMANGGLILTISRQIVFYDVANLYEFIWISHLKKLFSRKKWFPKSCCCQVDKK